MSLSATYTTNLSFAGSTFAIQNATGLTPEAAVPYSFDLPAALAATLTTMTSTTAGVLTLPAGHGITTSDKVDFYWSVNGVPYKRTGVTVTAADATTITFSAGAGDNLPTAGTTGAAQKQYPFTLPTFNGNDLACFGIDTGSGGTVVVVDSTPGQTLIPTVGGVNVYLWGGAGTGTNPLAGKTVTGLRITTSSLTPARSSGNFGLNY